MYHIQNMLLCIILWKLIRNFHSTSFFLSPCFPKKMSHITHFKTETLEFAFFIDVWETFGTLKRNRSLLPSNGSENWIMCTKVEIKF